MSDGRGATKSQDHARDLCFTRLVYLHLDPSSFPRAPRAPPWPDTKPQRESSGSRRWEQRPAQARAAHVRASDGSGHGGASLKMHLRIRVYGSMVGYGRCRARDSKECERNGGGRRLSDYQRKRCRHAISQAVGSVMSTVPPSLERQLRLGHPGLMHGAESHPANGLDGNARGDPEEVIGHTLPAGNSHVHLL